MTIKIFTLPVCPKCHLLMDQMKTLGVEYEELTMTDPEPQTELLINDVYTITTPVLFLNGKYYTHEELFDGESVSKEIIGLLMDLKQNDKLER